MKREFPYLFVIAAISLSFGAHYPFPQNKVTYGIKVVGDSSADVQYVYNSWLSGYYQEQDTLARITWDNDSQTASEGIGYGMLIMVCMDNAQNNTRPKFDKLWRYYKKFRDYNGVMNWKIDRFLGVAFDGQGGATDADLDAAAALILAYRQWGDTTYFSDARDLASAIWQVEVNADHFLKPGDSWDGQQDPSYFNTAAMELFKSVDANDWSTVINNCYDLLYKVCDTATGLPPDWCDQDGTIPSGEGFGWEAIRVPWRMAWAYSWFGREDAAKIDNKIVAWIRRATGNSPSAIKSLYTLDGTPQGDGNAAYAGGLSCAGMTSADNQEWINAGLTATQNALANTYYKKTLQVLYMLLLSGNFPLMYGSAASTRQITPFTAKRPGPDRKLVITPFAAARHYVSLAGKKMKGSAFLAMQPLIRMR